MLENPKIDSGLKGATHAPRFRLPRVIARRGGKVGRPPRAITPHFTPEQHEVAAQVLMYSKTVYNWVVSEAEFLGIDLNTPKGHDFFKENARKAAEKILK